MPLYASLCLCSLGTNFLMGGGRQMCDGRGQSTMRWEGAAIWVRHHDSYLGPKAGYPMPLRASICLWSGFGFAINVRLEGGNFWGSIRHLPRT